MTSPTKAAELAEKLDEAGLSMWQAYCDKKAEAEELREQMQQVAEQILRNDREGVVAWASGVHLSLEEDGSNLLRASEGRVPEGWRLVPAHPTAIMLGAGKYATHAGVSAETALAVYRDMLTAAPHPPAQQAAISDEALREIYAKHELAGANLVLSDLRRIAVDVLAMASPPPHKAEGAEPQNSEWRGKDQKVGHQ